MEYEERIQQLQQCSEPAPLPMIKMFDCKVCVSTVKNLQDHVYRVHQSSEADILERIQKMSRDEDPRPPPTIETTECKICNRSAKGFRDHLGRCHKITEAEHEELYNNGENCSNLIMKSLLFPCVF